MCSGGIGGGPMPHCAMHMHSPSQWNRNLNKGSTEIILKHYPGGRRHPPPQSTHPSMHLHSSQNIQATPDHELGAHEHHNWSKVNNTSHIVRFINMAIIPFP